MVRLNLAKTKIEYEAKLMEEQEVEKGVEKTLYSTNEKTE